MLRNISNIFIFGIGLPLIGSYISANFIQDWRLNHEPLHSVVESAGSFMAFATLYLIHILKDEFKDRRPETIWTINALFCMGALDLFHSLVHVGKAFVWLHSTATFIGGLVFALVWLPSSVSLKFEKSPKYFAILITLFGIASVVFPGLIPAMVQEGHFTLLAQGLNILGGLGYFLAFIFFFSKYVSKKEQDDYLLSAHCLLFAAAGVLFELSVLWDAAWWWWHILRLVAYLVLGAFFYKYAKKSTDRKQMLALLVDNSGEAIFSINQEGNIINWNKSAQRIFGYSEEEIIGKHLIKLAPVYREKDLAGVLESLKNNQVIKDSDVLSLSKFGSVLEVSGTFSPVTNHENLIVGASALIRDVSQTKENQIIKGLLKDVKQSNEDLNEFAHIVSHDLKGPLRSISACIAMIKENLIERKIQIDSELEENFSFVSNSCKRLNAMIVELLSFSKVGRNIKKEKLELEVVIQDSILNLQNQITETNAQITIANDMPKVVSSKTELTQVFQNIIANAVKYVAKDVKPAIEIKLQKRANGNNLISIKDNGIGIAAKDHDKVFKACTRVVSDDEYEGTGLGLSFCKKIIESLGDKIWFESELGKGTTFFVEFCES